MGVARPNSSRESSAEHFLIGLNFHKDQQLEGVELSTFFREVKVGAMGGEQQRAFKFVTCGDLSGSDPIEDIGEEEG